MPESSDDKLGQPQTSTETQARSEAKPMDGALPPAQSQDPTEEHAVGNEQHFETLESMQERSTEGSGLSVEHLQRQKLLLEIRDLEEKTSFRGRFTNYFKMFLDAFIPLATIAGLIFTVNATRRQWERQSQDNLNARFGAAYTALSGSSSSQRALGASQLSDLIASDNGIHDKDILIALVNQLSLEGEPTIRAQIIEKLDENASKISQEARNLTLQTIAARDRGIELSSGLSAQQIGLAYLDQEDGNVKVPRNGYIDWDQRSQGVIRVASTNEAVALRNLKELAGVVRSYLDAGAKATQLSGLYCIYCDFATEGRPTNLPGVDFTDAILLGSTFDGDNLSNADFTGASLSGVSFRRANLANAHFVLRRGHPDLQMTLARSDEVDWDKIHMSKSARDHAPHDLQSGPDFIQSNLTDAVFYGPWYTRINLPHSTDEKWILLGPNFEGANLTRTALVDVTYRDAIYIRYAKDFDSTHPIDAVSEYFATSSNLKHTGTYAYFTPLVSWGPFNKQTQSSRFDHDLKEETEAILEASSSSIPFVYPPWDVRDYQRRFPPSDQSLVIGSKQPLFPRISSDGKHAIIPGDSSRPSDSGATTGVSPPPR